jgi:hypothetical protein
MDNSDVVYPTAARNDLCERVKVSPGTAVAAETRQIGPMKHWSLSEGKKMETGQ